MLMKKLFDYRDASSNQTIIRVDTDYIDARLNIVKINFCLITLAVGLVDHLTQGVENTDVIHISCLHSKVGSSRIRIN